jgi:hypothetical protein
MGRNGPAGLYIAPARSDERRPEFRETGRGRDAIAGTAPNRRDRQIENPGGGRPGHFRRTSKGENLIVHKISYVFDQ